MNTRGAINLARKHVGNGATMESSARSCLADANRQYEAGDYVSAGVWALRSLAYSVGVLHADYKRVSRMSAKVRA